MKFSIKYSNSGRCYIVDEDTEDGGVEVCEMNQNWIPDSILKARTSMVSAAPDFAKHADDLLQLFHGDDDVCSAYGTFLNSLRPDERKEVEAALNGLQNALYKADGE